MRTLIVLFAAALLSGLPIPIPAQTAMTPNHNYVGLWATDENHVRHELLPNGRYVEARGQIEAAYQGRYEVRGTYIEYWDDTGFAADGEFVDLDTLHHAGMVLRRVRTNPSESSSREE